jgi:predicted amidohydrolase YtcJ
MLKTLLASFAILLATATLARAQAADVLLVNGKVLTVDAQFSTRNALAIRGGRIVAVGSDADVKKLSGPATRTIDLQGRTVIPGLIDSHMHAIRAALSFATEVNWIGASSLAEGLNRIHEAALRARPGAWLIVATPAATLDTFKEPRRPTQSELVAAAADHPAYVQLGYGWALLTPMALQALNLKSDTGVVTDNLVELFDRLPKPTFDDQVAGTKLFFRELNRLALTGVVDECGNNVTPQEYQAIFKVWRDGELTIRVPYMVCGFTEGHEFEDYKNYLALMPQGFGDAMLRFNGIGERITWAMQGVNGVPPADAQQKYYEIVRWAAQHNFSLTMHWNTDANVDVLLGIWERVNAEFPIKNLRWSIAHINDASPKTLARMKDLGIGWTVQDAAYNTSNEALKRNAEALKRQPPVNTGKNIGVVIGAGTDAHRVSTYNPFTVLQWFIDGKNASGTPLRGAAETPTRADALRFYTVGSAWMSFDEKERGSLEVGKLADLAVLTRDYMTIPVNEIGRLESLLTMVGGNVVYAAGPYAALDKR